MDFWSRLIGGSGRQNKQPSPKKVNPQQRLDRFKRVYNSALQGCSKPQLLAQPGPLIERLVVDLRQLSTLLREELRSPAPYTCLSFAAASQIYGAIGRAASICRDERVISEAVALFSILIDSEMEGFVSSRAFARSLMRFSMRILDSGYAYVTDDTEAQLVEVLFAIAAKIRLEPDILDVWFAPSGRAESEEEFVREKKSFVGITQKDDFPLCYLFMDRVHHEGRIGDFARTGLLYIFEAASRSITLDAWIVASDLPTLMASALGALYSQLSRELSLLQDPNGLPMLLAMSDYLEINQDTGVETISSESHKAHMATFLSDLTFWQDILDHCKSVDVKQTLLDHFQILFLQQLLYPSLLQSSDTDGGSSVAVMTYLNSILQTLTDDSLSNMLLSYLLATSQRSPAERPPSPSVMRRRSSLMNLTIAEPEEERLEPSLFNLVDLIHNGLQSKNPQTTFAALKLFTTILTLQPAHALGALVRLTSEHLTSERTIGGIIVETSAMMNIAASIGGPDGMDEAFSGASFDVRRNLEAIAVRRAQATHGFTSRNNSVVFSEMQKHVSKSMLDTNETGLKAIIALVENFLCNGVDTNLALSETVMALCMSINIDLCDLLVIRSDRYEPQKQQATAHTHRHLDPSWLDEEETSALTAALTINRPPTLKTSNIPLLISTLQFLESQVNSLRNSLSRFDALLQKRKAILQTPQQIDNLFSSPAKPLNPPKNPALSLSRHASPSPAPTASRPGSRHAGTPIQHIRHTSITSISSSPTRAASIPRGRRPSTNIAGPASPTTSIAHAHVHSRSPTSRNPAFASPAHASLNANVFRPPPPEKDHNLSPPRMSPLHPHLSPPKHPSRTNSLSARGLSPPSFSPLGAREPQQGTRYTASPGSSGENDAETLNLRVRFDSRGRVVDIATKSESEAESSPQTASGFNSGFASRARSPVGLAGRLRGEVMPGSSRGSSAVGTPDRGRSQDRETGGQSHEGGHVDGREGSSIHRGEGREREDDETSPRVGDREGMGKRDDGTKEVSLSHVLTNIVVLQNFILELVAVVQQRARVYEGEVRFS
ncbi:hypothetical protein KVT40_007556 [Elsinoe batatas]|uniref:Retinoic acid induced 16-like protein-domain-containing protein n=1 Tax=Elsinoe batatas TaxID=2601811 RepID=A0A8K0KXA9_9PEZI|nr:hypothetical protein KVT40_007556 [Elsinoe batatas]